MIKQHENYNVNKTVNVDEAFKANQEIANDLHMRFIKSLFFSNTKDNRQHYTLDGYSADDYPDYYGGSYINTDGNMVVLIKDEEKCDNYLDKNWYKDLCTRINSDKFIVRFVSNNLKALINVADEIVFGKFKNSLREYSYNGMSINIYENCVYVYVRNVDDIYPVKELIKDKIKDKICIVDITEETYNYSVNVYAGEGISLNSSSFFPQFSVAFRVKKTVNYSTTYGMLTCGHAFNGSSASVYLPGHESGLTSSVLIGSVSSTEQQSSGNTDAAVIRLNNNASPYNIIHNSSIQIHAGTYISLQVGNTVYMRGRASGVSCGVVKDISFSTTIDGDSFYDLVKADYISANGDSGGAVYSELNSYNFSFAVGIQTASSFTPLGFAYSLYTKIYNAINTLGFGLY